MEEMSKERQREKKRGEESINQTHKMNKTELQENFTALLCRCEAVFKWSVQK
jgi:hypothetical protein